MKNEIGRITRGHRYRCKACRGEFSVRKGTIFEDSKLPLRARFAALWLVMSRRIGIASTQLARELGVTQKTAWFMLGRIREVTAAMNDRAPSLSGIVEADETLIDGKARNMHANASRQPSAALPGWAILSWPPRSTPIPQSCIRNAARGRADGIRRLRLFAIDGELRHRRSSRREMPP